MRAITVILEADNSRRYVRVDYLGLPSTNKRYRLCNEDGDPVGPAEAIKAGVGTINSSHLILDMLQGPGEWGDSHMDEMVSIISNLG